MKNLKRFITALFTAVICLICIMGIQISSYAAESAKTVASEAESEADLQDVPAVFKVFSVDTSHPEKYVFDKTEYELYKAAVIVDMTSDGKCTALDAREVLRVSANLSVYNGDVACVDISRDGKISASDARMILRYSAKLDVYYLTSDGIAPDGFAKDKSGKTFYFSSGVKVQGLKTVNGSLYCFDSDGMVTGLKNTGGAAYYFGKDGKALNGKMTIDGKQYRFENYKAVTGLYKEGDSYYYYNEDGSMASECYVTVNGIRYKFGSDGKGKKCKDPSEYKIAMIGDSQVANIGMSDVTSRIDFYGKVSLHADTIFTKKVSGSSRYIIDEIKGRNYDVVIILVGINDLTYSDSVWANQYRNIIRGLKERAPDAIIYAHAILPVNEAAAKKNGYSCTNAQVKNKNSVIKNVAQEENVNYMDAASALGASGGLPSGASTDGVHLTRSYCNKWSSWLVDTVCK